MKVFFAFIICFLFIYSSYAFVYQVNKYSMMKSMKGSLKMLSDITPPELSQKSDRTTMDSALDFLEDTKADEEEEDEVDLYEIYADSPDIEIPYELIAKLQQDELDREVNKALSQQSINTDKIKNAVIRWKLHEKDCGSPEVQIATLNEKVKYLTTHLLKNKHDLAAKRGLNSIVNQRRKLLNYLYETDKHRAELIVKELGIRFRPPGRLWDKEAKYGAFKNTKSKWQKIRAEEKAIRDQRKKLKASV